MIMARGADEKLSVQNQILGLFPNAFVYGKEIRVPVGDVQIKIALTCAKDNVEPGGDVALPGAKPIIIEGDEPTFGEAKEVVEPSEDELAAVNKLMSALEL